ncbi:Tfp pilus assembly protein PilM [Desulfohalobium retbaense]|uniref:Tfp pilus assembly protein ATPase PilM-like protein n=1 Tax=Desulfohalobium retbaense (strain ATCC 49708 / DSM 5692 / JCM 16813 / HR100) TaxID=485915 RepID=C8X4Q2_DESRD|nr:Tfp pilus assembly protein PilM [Desulfohalobium retbaense]ACV69275.1 Tfp pilus assembly protein ATPase PilM-like protein [Desulfohalobium retbaense DSM 5692]
MANEKDVSSTEKLLHVIRNKPEDETVAVFESQAVHNKQKRTSKKSKRNHFVPFKPKETIGVEIQDTHLNVVRMAQSGHGWEAIQALTIPMREEMALDSPEFRSFLKSQLQSIEGIKKAHVWAMLSASQGEIWHTKIPLMKKGLANAVFWAAKRDNDFEEDKVVFDYRIQNQIADKDVKKYWAMVSTFPKNTVKNLKDVFSKSGVDLEGITLPAFSLQNLFTHNWVDSKEKPFAVLHIYQHNSSINIYDSDNKLLLSRTTKTGLESMLESMIQEQEVSAPEVHVLGDSDNFPPQYNSPTDKKQALKLINWLETGSKSHPDDHQDRQYHPQKILDMIAPAMERLARQVERTIAHSINVLGNPAPARIYLGGRLIPAESVTAFLQDQLGLEVQVLEPLTPTRNNISSPISSLNKEERIFLTSTTGLALSSTEQTPNFLNTAKNQEKQRVAKRNATLVASAVIAIYLLIGGYWVQLNNELAQVRQKVFSLNHRLEEFSPLISQKMIKDMIAQVHKDSSTLQDHSHDLLPVAAMRDVISATPERVRLFKIRMETGKPKSGQDVQVLLKGYIIGEEKQLQTYLASYLYRLRQSPVFNKTTLQESSIQEVRTLGKVLDFVIKVNLEQI